MCICCNYCYSMFIFVASFLSQYFTKRNVDDLCDICCSTSYSAVCYFPLVIEMKS